MPPTITLEDNMGFEQFPSQHLRGMIWHPGSDHSWHVMTLDGEVACGAQVDGRNYEEPMPVAIATADTKRRRGLATRLWDHLQGHYSRARSWSATPPQSEEGRALLEAWGFQDDGLKWVYSTDNQ